LPYGFLYFGVDGTAIRTAFKLSSGGFKVVMAALQTFSFHWFSLPGDGSRARPLRVAVTLGIYTSASSPAIVGMYIYTVFFAWALSTVALGSASPPRNWARPCVGGLRWTC
jgi:hypothetical protein